MGHLILLSSKIQIVDGNHAFVDLMVRRFLSFQQFFPLQVCLLGNKFWLFREHTFYSFLFQSFFFDRISKAKTFIIRNKLLKTQCHLIMEN